MLSFAGCSVKNPDDANKDLQKQLDEDNKKNQDTVDQVKNSMEQGGQPGNIKVSGIIVKDDAKTDVRITVLAKTGLGKDGTEAKLNDTYKPALATKIEKMDLGKLIEDKSLIAVGCDEKMVSDIAKERSLEVQKVPAPIAKDLIVVQAKTVLLCGNLDDLKYQYVTVSADELILNGVDYTQTGFIGWTNLNTNKLVLVGSNSIQTKGVDTSMVVAISPSIELKVAKEISSDEDGKLLIIATGSNYKADAK